MEINYKNSLVSLSNSILKYYNIDLINPSLESLDVILKKKNYKKIVLMVFDGLGTYNLDLILDKFSFLQKNRYSEISSTFPPTTTSATTSLLSGMYPSEHLYLGWSMYFKDYNKYINIFPNTNFENEVDKELSVKEYFKYETIVEKIRKHNFNATYLSPFGEISYDTYQDSLNKLDKIITEHDNYFVYYYNANPDSYMHEFGIKSKEAVKSINLINSSLEEFTKLHDDTLFIITSDHGHVDVETINIDEYEDFSSLINGFPYCEPRCIAINLKNNKENEFLSLFNKYFSKEFILLTKEEVLNNKIHGEKFNDDYIKYLPDYYIISTSNKILQSKKLSNTNFKGHHAGFTDNEMNVPLILVNI